MFGLLKLGIKSSSAFDPLSLSPKAWYDLAIASTVTTVSGKAQYVDDISGNDYTLQELYSTKRPIYQSSTGSLLFSNTVGNEMNQTTLGSSMTDKFTVYSIANVFNVSSSTRERSVVFNLNYGSAVPYKSYTQQLWVELTNNHAVIIYAGNNSNFHYLRRWVGFELGDRKVLIKSTADYTNNVYGSYTLMSNGSYKGISGPLDFKHKLGSGGFGIGTKSYNIMSGHIYEMMVFDKLLTTDEDTDILNYFKEKHPEIENF